MGTTKSVGGRLKGENDWMGPNAEASTNKRWPNRLAAQAFVRSVEPKQTRFGHLKHQLQAKARKAKPRDEREALLVQQVIEQAAQR